MTDTGKDLERGRRIHYVRTKLLKLRSQAAFADWLGDVTRGAVGNWELGSPIGLDNLSAIAGKAQIPFDWLAFGNGAPPTAARRVAQIETVDTDAELENAMAAFDGLPARLQKLFLKRALGLEGPDQSMPPGSTSSATDGEEPR